ARSPTKLNSYIKSRYGAPVLISLRQSNRLYACTIRAVVFVLLFTRVMLALLLLEFETGGIDQRALRASYLSRTMQRLSQQRWRRVGVQLAESVHQLWHGPVEPVSIPEQLVTRRDSARRLCERAVSAQRRTLRAVMARGSVCNQQCESMRQTQRLVLLVGEHHVAPREATATVVGGQHKLCASEFTHYDVRAVARAHVLQNCRFRAAHIHLLRCC